MKKTLVVYGMSGIILPSYMGMIKTMITRWWFQYFVFLPLPGEMIQFDYIFEMGWNHQLDKGPY